MAALYRACDVLVHPYRGEGFAMPVLEAMACGLAVITTAGGPTDEFCPPEASWRIRSARAEFAEARVGDFETAGRPWMLEPDVAHLEELLLGADRDASARAEKGAAGTRAAQPLSWSAVGARYRARVEALAASPPRPLATVEPEEDVDLRVVAAPAWHGEDRLEELIVAWSDATDTGTSACLYLLADDETDDVVERLLTLAERAGVDLDACADITVLPSNAATALGVHAAMDAYVPLHPGVPGHMRAAIADGNAVLGPRGSALKAWFAERAPVASRLSA